MRKTPSSSSSGSGSTSSADSKKKVTFAQDIIQKDEKKFKTKYRTRDIDGLEKIFLCIPNGASAKVSLYGGQVLSWKTKQGEELLFTSSKSLRPQNDLRGGIQVCFPQFGKGDALNQHGFARINVWETEENPPPFPSKHSSNNVFVDLLLKPIEKDLKDNSWPNRCELRLRVALGDDGNLTLIPRVRNMSHKPCTFAFAFHTYFLVSDIGDVRVEGLELLDYHDNLKDRALCIGQDSLTFESEIDRLYKDSCDANVTLFDHQARRTIRIRRKGLPNIPVWNPWDKKAKTLPEFGKNEYMRMLCVGAAVVDPPVTLQPGQEWTGVMELIFIRGS